MPHILGLTGNIASGKTTVGLMLLELGAQLYVDADAVVHELYLPGQPLVAELTNAFGPSIQNSEGGIDRKVLGQLVFGDQEKLRLLESIVHPAVQQALFVKMYQLNEIGPDAVGVLDAVKLVESGYTSFCQGIWIVTAPAATQLQRMMETRGLSEHDARLRLAAQPDIEAKRAVATEIIENSGNIDQLRVQVKAAWDRFIASISTMKE